MKTLYIATNMVKVEEEACANFIHSELMSSEQAKNLVLSHLLAGMDMAIIEGAYPVNYLKHELAIPKSFHEDIYIDELYSAILQPCIVLIPTKTIVVPSQSLDPDDWSHVSIKQYTKLVSG